MVSKASCTCRCIGHCLNQSIKQWYHHWKVRLYPFMNCCYFTYHSNPVINQIHFIKKERNWQASSLCVLKRIEIIFKPKLQLSTYNSYNTSFGYLVVKSISM